MAAEEQLTKTNVTSQYPAYSPDETYMTPSVGKLKIPP